MTNPTMQPCHLDMLDCWVVRPAPGMRLEGVHFIVDAQEVHIIMHPHTASAGARTHARVRVRAKKVGT